MTAQIINALINARVNLLFGVLESSVYTLFDECVERSLIGNLSLGKISSLLLSSVLKLLKYILYPSVNAVLQRRWAAVGLLDS
ncbi:hypothetical protein DVH05_025212 [Phytophthora capsici]|nr:hypothetical protein DVH05_025212 [Phytophthora capsici]